MARKTKGKPAAAASAAAASPSTAAGGASARAEAVLNSKVKVVKPFLRGTAAANAYYTDIAALSGGASARQVHTVLEGLRKVCARDLKDKSIFKLHSIANFTLRKAKVSGEQEITGPGWSYSVRGTPAGQKRVYCAVLKELENAVLY
jgi:hypothetical protein